MNDPYLILGVPTKISRDDLEIRYQRLKLALEGDFHGNMRAKEQATRALATVNLAYNQVISNKTITTSSENREKFGARLRIGQLCLASGMISLNQLKEAMDEQAETGQQLGEIFRDKQIISQEELDGLLLGQDLIDSPDAITDPFAIRLIALGLVSEEAMIIALLENRFSSESIAATLKRRGWLEQEIIELLIWQPSSRA
jgi:hypothetical protein